MKDYCKSAVLLAFGLIVLTVLACLPYAPQGPFDARTYTRLAGMRLVQHSWTAFFEPLSAPLKIIAGAPNFKIAILAVLIWVFLAGMAWGLFASLRERKRKQFPAVVFGAIRSALVATLTLALLISFFVIARIPGWRLVVWDPNLIVADLHCHTVISHDGLVSLRTNLDWHKSCGYDMEAITENEHLVDHKITWLSPQALDKMPALMSGVEDHTGARAICVALCPNPDIRLGKSIRRAAWFAKKIHEEGGAVFVVTLKYLRTSDIARLADDGVDGFEIANEGHPDVPPRLTREVLAVCRSRGLVLLADSDFHGWSGLARTWNVITAPGAAALSRSQRVNVVVRKLRERDSAEIIPVVAGFIGKPSIARAIFSPFVETARYAMELSPVRVISWWVWAWAVFAVWVLLDMIGFRAGDILLASLVWATGAGLILAGISVIGQGKGATEYGFFVGLIAIAAGTVAFGIATFRGVGFLTKKRKVYGAGRLK